MLVMLCMQKSERHLHALSFTSLKLEREGRPPPYVTQLLFCSLAVSKERLRALRHVGWVLQVFTLSSLPLYLRHHCLFCILGSAVEILKEWNVTGKKKVKLASYYLFVD